MTSLDHKIIGQSKPAVELKKMIGLIASSGSPVIINGPTGSGKELVAEAIHEESRRKGNFVALNCAAIPSELIEWSSVRNLRLSSDGVERIVHSITALLLN